MTKTLEQLQKELAKDGYMVKKASELLEEKKFRTGIFGIDYILDGGVSMCEGGHRIEFFGAESCGKTTFALEIIKRYQEEGKRCAFVDTEHSYDKSWASQIGIDNDNLLILTPDSSEEFGDMCVKIIPDIDLMVVDSIAGLIPAGESERDTDEPQMALSARVNSLIVKKIYHVLGDRSPTLIFINQLRTKIGTIYGNPDTTNGGRALLHLYNSRIEFKKGKPIEQGTGDQKERVGIEIRMNCVKNKKGKPFRKTEVDLYLNGFLDNQKSLFFAGVKTGVIERSGNTYIFGDIKGVGQEKFRESFKDKDWKKLENEIWKVMK